MNNLDPTTAKYMIKAKISADGIIDKPDVVGAVFGQTEGLLGEELNLRDLQKTGRIGRIEVDINSKGGKTHGEITMSSSLDQVETAIIASALETVDRVGPCKSTFRISAIEDVRIKKREIVVERAKELLNEMIQQNKDTSVDIADKIKVSVQIEEVTTYGPEKLTAGPNVKNSESIIIVEGRSDVLNLLKAGIKNAIAVDGTNIPESVQELSRERVTTAFVDGDRGGELILRELFQVAEVDFVARAPRSQEVEELTAKQITKCLRNKVPGDQYMEANNFSAPDSGKHENGNRRDGNGRRDERHNGKREDRREERRDDKREERRSDRPKPETMRTRFNNEAVERYKKKDAPQRELRRPADEDGAEIPDTAPAVPEPEPVKAEPVKAEQEKETVREERKERPARQKREPKAKNLSPQQEVYRDMLLEVSGTRNAHLLDESNAVLSKVAVKDLANALKEDSKGAQAVVFDGVISQRMLDQSSESGIRTLVGQRRGKITKLPEGIDIYAKEDLC